MSRAPRTAPAKRYTSLRSKALLIVATTILGLSAIVFIPFRVFLLGTVTRLEQELVRVDVERATSAILNETRQLDVLDTSFAIWDDTYAFVQDRNASYVQKNFYDQVFVDSRIDLAIIADTSGRVVFSKAVDQDSGQPMPIPERFRRLSAGDPLLASVTGTDSVTGVVALPEAPMVVAAHPIVTSEGAGPVRGTILMGRYLDQAELARLADETHTQLTIANVSAAISEDMRAAQAALDKAPGPWVQSLSSELAAGYIRIDALDRNALLLRVTLPRRVYAQGLLETYSFTASLLVVALVFGAVVMLLVDRVIVSRIATLSRAVRRIGADGDLSQRAVASGNDELTQLADSINEMIAALEQAQTERHQAQEIREQLLRQEQALKTKRDFISTVSHELRTPLTPIKGFSELMLLGEGGSLTDEQRRFVETIQLNSTQMIGLVDDLLEVGRIESERVTLYVSQIDLRRAIGEAIESFQIEIARKQIVVESDLDPLLPAIEADEQRIRQVLNNLISNAIKYNRAQGRLGIRAAGASDSHVTIAIEDTGVGIAPDQQDKLFTPFYRAESSARSRVRGTGLGLSIAKAFVELHGGTIEVDSQPDVGSRFTVTLPIRHAPVQP